MNISINVNQYDETKLSFGRRNPDNAKSVRSTLAKKRADKLVGNIFQSDKKMDLSVNEMKEKREALLSDTTQQLKELSDLKEQRKEMLSQAEDPVMAQNIKDIDERMTEIRKKVEENRSLAKTYGQTVSDVKVERLKSHAMVDASNEAEVPKSWRLLCWTMRKITSKKKWNKPRKKRKRSKKNRRRINRTSRRILFLKKWWNNLRKKTM